MKRQHSPRLLELLQCAFHTMSVLSPLPSFHSHPVGPPSFPQLHWPACSLQLIRHPQGERKLTSSCGRGVTSCAVSAMSHFVVITELLKQSTHSIWDVSILKRTALHPSEIIMKIACVPRLLYYYVHLAVAIWVVLWASLRILYPMGAQEEIFFPDPICCDEIRMHTNRVFTQEKLVHFPAMG